jgi:2-oxoisovalerate dehydrogenase E1 component
MDTIEERELAPAGHVQYQFSARGHELSQVLLGLTLTHPYDGVFPYYRSRPLALTLGLTPRELFAAGLGRSGSPPEGRDCGVLYSRPGQGGPTILPAPGDVGAQYSPAAGWAQASVYRRVVLGQAEWGGALAVAHGGDGSICASGFWAALNIATTHRLPLLFFIEDNGYALSVPTAQQYPQGNIADNLASFGNLRIVQASGVNPAEAAGAIAAAVAHVRAAGGPVLLRLSVPRLAGHSIADTQAYKSPEQRAAEEARDPLPQLRGYLAGRVDWEALDRAVEAEVRAALAEAWQLPEPDPAQARRFVFAGDWPQQVGGLAPEGVQLPAGSPEPQPDGPRLNLIEGVRRVLAGELALNPRLVVFGEDVGAKGGVHGATQDLQRQFGEARVFDTSLSEDGIIGRAVGLALAGLRPVPEIQFRKYLDPATEALQTCGWLRWRTAGRFAAPLVVRVPVGLGKKGNDPFHTVTGEATLAHMLGWRLAFPSNAEDAVGLLRAALRGEDPVVFFEHRALLDTPAARRPYPGDDYVLPFGRGAVLLAGAALTVVTWGEMVHRCLEAARSFAGQVEVIDLRTIAPWDQALVLASVRKTGKCLVVHEDTLTAGFAAEIIAVIAAEAFQDLDAPVRRLATPDCPIPYNAGLAQALVPGAAAIAGQMADLLAF